MRSTAKCWREYRVAHWDERVASAPAPFRPKGTACALCVTINYKVIDYCPQ